MKPPTCSKVSLNSVKVKPGPSKYHMYENLKTALGSITTSFNFKLYISVPFFKTLMLISYACRMPVQMPGLVFFILHSQSLSLTKFSYALKAPLSRTWNVFLLGLDWKGIPGIGHSYPLTAVTHWLSDFTWTKGFLRTCHLLFFFDVSFLSVRSDHYLHSTPHSFIKPWLQQPQRWSWLNTVCEMWFVSYGDYNRSRNSVHCLYTISFNCLLWLKMNSHCLIQIIPTHCHWDYYYTWTH